MMSTSRLGAAKTVAMEMIITEPVDDSDQEYPFQYGERGSSER